MSDAIPTPPDDDTVSEQDATELSRAEEIEINRQIALEMESFEGGIEG